MSDGDKTAFGGAALVLALGIAVGLAVGIAVATPTIEEAEILVLGTFPGAAGVMFDSTHGMIEVDGECRYVTLEGLFTYTATASDPFPCAKAEATTTESIRPSLHRIVADAVQSLLDQRT